jgi:3-deoxy-7-phosphoheptulonate synthase
LQEVVWQNIVEQKMAGSQVLVGAMVESNLFEGSQKIPGDRSQLRYGVSITDQCVGWETTERMVLKAHATMQDVPAV